MQVNLLKITKQSWENTLRLIFAADHEVIDQLKSDQGIK